MENQLSNYEPIADAISILLHPYTEVVIHDLENGNIFYIANPYSGRKKGDPSYLNWDNDEYDLLLEKKVVGPYEKVGNEGQRIRSITAFLRDEKANPIGILCINLDFLPLESVFDSALELLNGLIRPINLEAPPEILFREDWLERVKLEIHAFRRENGQKKDSMNAEERRELIRRLDHKRLFYARKSVEQVARILKISRATAYSDLKLIRRGL